MVSMETERLQKILARAGYGSRRACEQIIDRGRVTVDGKTASLGDKADPEAQQIRVDGVPIPKPEPRLYIVVNKPRGVITTTSDPRGRRTVLDLVQVPQTKGGSDMRLYPVGRLDADSEGLLLLTNDGPLTQRLTHPKYGHLRVYRVLVEGEPTEETLDRWRKGITLEGLSTRFDKVVVEARQREQTWMRVTVHEGRNHMVRRMVAALGHSAKRLIRTEMGTLQLGDLQWGKWRFLSVTEVRALRREAQLPATGKTPQMRKPARRGAPRPRRSRRSPR